MLAKTLGFFNNNFGEKIKKGQPNIHEDIELCDF